MVWNSASMLALMRGTTSNPVLDFTPADWRSLLIGVVGGLLTAALLWAVAKGWRRLSHWVRDSNAASRERARRYAVRLAESDMEYTQSLADYRAVTTPQAVYLVGIILLSSFAGYAGMGAGNPAVWLAIAAFGSGMVRATNTKNRVLDAFRAAGYSVEFRGEEHVVTLNYDEALDGALHNPQAARRPGHANPLDAARCRCRAVRFTSPPAEARSG